MKPWVQRLLGKLCLTCGGAGWVNPPYVNVHRLPCTACLGTGLRIIEKAEQTREKYGDIKERRRRR